MRLLLVRLVALFTVSSLLGSLFPYKAQAEDVDITVTDRGGGAFDVFIDGPFLWNWDLICIGDEYTNCLYCVEATGSCPDSVVLCEWGDKTVGEVRDCKGKIEHDGEGRIDKRTKKGSSGEMISGDGKGHSFSVTYK